MKWESQDQRLHVDHLMKMGAKLIMEGVDFHDAEDVLDVMGEISARIWRDQSGLPDKVRPVWFEVVRAFIPVIKLASELSAKTVDESFLQLATQHPELVSRNGKFNHNLSDDDWKVVEDWQNGIGKLGKKLQDRFIQVGVRMERVLSSMELSRKDRRVVDGAITSFFPGLLMRWYRLPEKAKSLFFELFDEDLRFLESRRTVRESSKRFN